MAQDQDFDPTYIGSEEDSAARVRVDGSLNVHLAFPDAKRHPERPQAFGGTRKDERSLHGSQFAFDRGKVRCLRCFKEAGFITKTCEQVELPKDISKRPGFHLGLPGTPVCKNSDCPTNRPELG